MTRRSTRSNFLLLTCEHGGNRIPKPYGHLFSGAETVLASHRGWDPGALTLAKVLSRRLDRPLFSVTWSRLFVEANRSPTNVKIWSQFTAGLQKEERARILERWWRPHRHDVELAVTLAIAHDRRVVHVAVHSFTPELDGEVRNADIGLLYDSRRKAEGDFCRRWSAALREGDPSLRVRFNYPYSGASDGLTTALRKVHPPSHYLGIELEINQAFVGSARWKNLERAVTESLRRVA